MTKITKPQFHSYEAVRQSAVTNMYDTETVSDLSGLDREQIVFIMNNFAALSKEHGKDVDPNRVEEIKSMTEQS